MIATIIIEVSLALYTIWRYKLSVITRLVTLTLVMLATFQLSEYFVCTNNGAAAWWSRLGFAAITTLPALGIHILHVLAGKPKRLLVTVAYATMALFIGFFLLHPNAFFGHQCTGNYVIFQMAHTYGGWFTAYYYSWLVIGIMLAVYWAGQLQAKGKSAYRQLEAAWAMVAGYMVFILPTILANTVKPETKRGIPSIMCGFAVLFALILTLYILPRAAKPRTD